MKKDKYGKILSITEITKDYMSGYKVITDNTSILVMISNCQQCCEDWGYFSSEEDTSYFIGATLRAINLVDTALDVHRIKEVEDGLQEKDIQFVNFETDRGTLQLAVYNEHNGYYGHDVLVSIGDTVICDFSL